eukprot:Phypoly_transcript_23889.p1 GENE.Phypoly_transcript_23889~~Phypoly_transcript_23889.p1  ORF type:complete len:112 (+),score=7.02 Phypoly_transcript_23889:181-516(+)
MCNTITICKQGAIYWDTRIFRAGYDETYFYFKDATVMIVLYDSLDPRSVENMKWRLTQLDQFATNCVVLFVGIYEDQIAPIVARISSKEMAEVIPSPYLLSLLPTQLLSIR